MLVLILKVSKINSNDREEIAKSADLYQTEKLLTYNDFYLLAVLIFPVIEYVTPVRPLMFYIHISYLCKHRHSHPARPQKNICISFT